MIPASSLLGMWDRGHWTASQRPKVRTVPASTPLEPSWLPGFPSDQSDLREAFKPFVVAPDVRDWN